MKLNKEQKKAVTAIDTNVSVNAGAGSGKTKVLVDRYIYLLENGKLKVGKEIESIVAITFTKKASQEMKERIREGLRNRFCEGKKWRRLYRDLEKANIGTIHSFCSNIIRENPVESGIDPLFQIMDDYESDELLYETINECLIKGIEKDEDIYELVKSFNIDILDRLINTFMGLYKKIRSIGVSFEEVKKMTLNNIDNLKIDKEKIDSIKNNFSHLIEKSKKNSKFNKLKEDSVWLQFLNSDNFDETIVETLEYLQEYIGTMKGEEERIEELKRDINSIMKVGEKNYRQKYETLLDLFIYIDEIFMKKKKRLGCLDYDDLQILVLKLFKNNSIKEKYQKKFRYIMVDEFQDTNELQKKILYKLCSKERKLDRENLFIVGDPKQSIYGFRGADVEVFFDVMKDIEGVSKNPPIVLSKNYRSVSPVLDFVNNIFSKLMGKRYDGLDANKEIEGVRVEVLEKKDLEVPLEVTEGDYSKYYESRLAAKRIKQLVSNGQYSYKDFAILFRSTTEDYYYEEALKEYGIPYYNVGGKGFYYQEEIIDLINGLKSISNSFDTISIVGLLRSPMFGISDKTVYWLLRKREGDLLNSLEKENPHINDKEKEKVLKANKVLKELRLKKDLMCIDEILEELIERTYFIESLMLKHGNKQSVANVYKFLEITKEFSQMYNGSIEEFIDFIEKLKIEDIEESQAKIETEGGDSVKLLTIHKSKGLQFKVVIIPQMAKRFNTNTSDIIFDKTIGVGIKHGDISPLYDEINQTLKEKEEEENKRILYVAMTRAEERLILGNQGKNSGFKKFINELLENNEYELIEELNIEEEKIEEIKKIEYHKKDVEKNHNDKFPLIMNIDNFDQKSFSIFSVTQYKMFKECKRKFYMNYYRRLPVNNLKINEPLKVDKIAEIDKTKERYILEPMLRGEIVHTFCEMYRKDIEKEILLDSILDSFQIEKNKDVLAQINPYIENYLKYYNEDYDKMYKEKEFYYKLDDHFIYGIIDRINIKGDKAEILDFKTDKVRDKKELSKKYESQLQLYVKVFQSICDLEVKRARLFLLETGDYVDIDISHESLEKNICDFKDFIQFVTKNNDIKDYEKGTKCNEYCQFKFLCK